MTTVRGFNWEPATRPQTVGGSIYVADMFCGLGGLSLGVKRFCRDAGIGVHTALAVDTDEYATRVFDANHRPERVQTRSLLEVDYSGCAEEGIDLVMAGPPCQGHSPLNNHTRHDDPRNGLYSEAARFAAFVKAPLVLLENVPQVVRSVSEEVDLAIRILREAEYNVEDGVLSAAEMGWPQSRKRHFLAAHRYVAPTPMSEVQRLMGQRPQSVLSAFEGLPEASESCPDPLHRPSRLSKDNRERIDAIFDAGVYDCPESHRPARQVPTTTYSESYCRMRPDRPSPTITGMFRTPGTGRFIHPEERRVITHREAARLQGFPDNYDFLDGWTRTSLATHIGNAVPVALGYAAILSLFVGGVRSRSLFL